MAGSTLIRTLVLIAVAVAAGLSTPADHLALAQDAPPVLVSQEACDVDSEPREVASQTGEPPPIDAAIWDYSEGVPADSLLIETLVDDRLTRFMGCVNANDIGAISTLVTEEYMRRYPFPDDMDDAPAPLLDEDAVTFTAVDAVRVHESGEVTVFLTLQDPTYCAADIDLAVVFRQVDDTWLVDDTAQVVDFAPIPWQPPGIRDADEPQCGDAASINGIQSLQQPPPQEGERPTRTAKSVVDQLREDDGVIRLSGTDVDGFLDLRGVPSDKIVATGVRFRDGIDVSLPIDVSGTDQSERPGMDFYFKDVEFAGNVNLTLDRFEKFECLRCTFRGTLDLSYVDADHVSIRGTRFESAVLFSYIEGYERIEIADSHFYGPADFTGGHAPSFLLTQVSSAEPLQITWEVLGEGWIEQRIHAIMSADVNNKLPLLDEIDSDLHFLEKNFSALGQERDADEAHAERLRLKYDHYHDWNDVEKWQLTSIGFLTGWGADPWRPLKLIGAIVAFFGMVYWKTSPFEPADPSKSPIGKEPGWLFSMLYSIDTFVPFTIVTGVKDWGWVIRGRMRWAAVSERLIGAIVSAAYAFNIGAYLL